MLVALTVTSCLACAEPGRPPTVSRLFAEADWQEIGGDALVKRALKVPVPSRLSDSLTVPPGGVLHFETSVRMRYETRVALSVSVVADGEEHLVYRAEVEAPRRTIHPWVAGQVDLVPWEGRAVELVFAAEEIESEAVSEEPREAVAPEAVASPESTELAQAGEDPAPPTGSESAERPRRGPKARGKALWTGLYVAAGVDEENRPPSVVLVLIDSLRADRLGVYGGERDLTPHLDRLAERGATFDNAFSQTNWTLPSIASLVSGLYPTHHGVVLHKFRLQPDRTTLARLFWQNGYVTAGFHSGGFAGRRYGFADGYDEYREIANLEDLGKVFEWLETHRELPFFLFLHTYDVHSPYTTVPEEYWQRYVDPADEATRELLHGRPKAIPEEELGPAEMEVFADLYDGEVRYVDERLGELFAVLERDDLFDTSFVVVTSDHGEEFWDHGSFEHRTPNLHTELVRVPLILTGPEIIPGVRNDWTVELVDLLPTLVDLFELEGLAGAPIDGRSFAAAIRKPRPGGATPDRESLALSEYAGMRSVRSDRWTLIASAEGEARLYDRSADPAEMIDVSAEYPEIRDRFLERLEAMRDERQRAARAGETEIDDALLDELRALGYLE